MLEGYEFYYRIQGYFNFLFDWKQFLKWNFTIPFDFIQYTRVKIGPVIEQQIKPF